MGMRLAASRFRWRRSGVLQVLPIPNMQDVSMPDRGLVTGYSDVAVQLRVCGSPKLAYGTAVAFAAQSGVMNRPRLDAW